MWPCILIGELIASTLRHSTSQYKLKLGTERSVSIRIIHH